MGFFIFGNYHVAHPRSTERPEVGKWVPSAVRRTGASNRALPVKIGIAARPPEPVMASRDVGASLEVGWGSEISMTLSGKLEKVIYAF